MKCMAQTVEKHFPPKRDLEWLHKSAWRRFSASENAPISELSQPGQCRWGYALLFQLIMLCYFCTAGAASTTGLLINTC